MLELTVAPCGALTAPVRGEIVALCEAAFAHDFGRAFELLGPTAFHVLARLDGRLAVHSCWVTRWLQPNGLPPLRTAYIEAVAVAPDLQRRGLGSRVMRCLAAQIQGYSLGGLSTGSVGFYTPLGWELWLGPTAIRLSEALLDTPDETVMILRTARTPALDVTTLLTAEWREGEIW